LQQIRKFKGRQVMAQEPTRNDFLSIQDLKRKYYLQKLGLTESNYTTEYLKQIYQKGALSV
jgi:hypothetical protein